MYMQLSLYPTTLDIFLATKSKIFMFPRQQLSSSCYKTHNLLQSFLNRLHCVVLGTAGSMICERLKVLSSQCSNFIVRNLLCWSFSLMDIWSMKKLLKVLWNKFVQWKDLIGNATSLSVWIVKLNPVTSNMSTLSSQVLPWLVRNPSQMIFFLAHFRHKKTLELWLRLKVKGKGEKRRIVFKAK